MKTLRLLWQWAIVPFLIFAFYSFVLFTWLYDLGRGED